MTIQQTPLAPFLEQPHRNHGLFADHYLADVLPRHPAWEAVQAEAAPVREEIAARLAAHVPSTKEAQTEDDLIKPVLTALGHTFEVQVTLKSGALSFEPDYILYRDSAAVQHNKGKKLTAADLQATALAVAEAKYWERPLDTTLWERPLDTTLKTGTAAAKENPAKQIAEYLYHADVSWGILTNGRSWRLYHRNTARFLNVYYEVDLPALVAAGDLAAFAYFFAFFRRAAFDPTEALHLNAMLQESTDYAQTISQHLKEQVYTALRHLAQGFLDYPSNQLQPIPATLTAMYDHSLIVLYRLLFILYAEARGLLPLRESNDYRTEYSLDAIKRRVAKMLDSGAGLLPTSMSTWARLKDLFTIINDGSPPLKVATFNGGLFDPQKHPFLEQYSIGDAQLLRAIDQLARVQQQFIDYRDLNARHLGTIYEGLLENQFQPLAAPEPDTTASLTWTIDIFNDKGERKRTGSYYTPDYIVEYILEQAVGPVLAAAVANQPDDAAKVQAVLAVNVLDPSMGSGHFLVAATEYIARFLLNLSEVSEAERSGASDLVYWKRRVAQSCIYGVDLNPLAVDLAKLSLWLDTTARDKPLSFLDHHLRCGNALVGARLDSLRPLVSDIKAKQQKKKAAAAAAAGQVSMFGDSDFQAQARQAVMTMSQIEALAGDSIDEVREQERLYEALQASLRAKYERAADLATATGFDLVFDPGLWKHLIDYATGHNLTGPRQFGGIVAAAAAQAPAHRFFHWELAFPEVFF
ncbi:MAG: N-6 DNA methylase [Chloroflexaceae bacterium]|nr:N-6 DNA methylase [Chloroflexaceae bacterium]